MTQHHPHPMWGHRYWGVFLHWDPGMGMTDGLWSCTYLTSPKCTYYEITWVKFDGLHISTNKCMQNIDIYQTKLKRRKSKRIPVCHLPKLRKHMIMSTRYLCTGLRGSQQTVAPQPRNSTSFSSFSRSPSRGLFSSVAILKPYHVTAFVRHSPFRK